jgi:hypothetical protein
MIPSTETWITLQNEHREFHQAVKNCTVHLVFQWDYRLSFIYYALCNRWRYLCQEASSSWRWVPGNAWSVSSSRKLDVIMPDGWLANSGEVIWDAKYIEGRWKGIQLLMGHIYLLWDMIVTYTRRGKSVYSIVYINGDTWIAFSDYLSLVPCSIYLHAVE